MRECYSLLSDIFSLKFLEILFFHTPFHYTFSPFPRQSWNFVFTKTLFRTHTDFSVLPYSRNVR